MKIKEKNSSRMRRLGVTADILEAIADILEIIADIVSIAG